MSKKVELLAPAGTLEKLKIAVAYGADAVYFGGKAFNLRARSNNFSNEDMKKGLKWLHERGKKGYLTLNFYPKNFDIEEVISYLQSIQNIEIDGIIVSNLGILTLVKEYLPDVPIHISTQANVTDWVSAKAWKELGAERVILARELTLGEIKGCVEKSGVDIEVFIHGAMCMAYSGRCLLSKYMTGRDANRGDCAHPCRWQYYVREKTRKDELYEVEEDEYGMYIFNSKDLMLYDYIDKLIDAGVMSLKIEGRIKGILYLATVVRAYRLLIDAIENGKPIDPRWRETLFEANNRGYHAGFIESRSGFESNLESSRTYAPFDLLGYIDADGLFLAKAPFDKGNEYQYFTPDGKEGVVKIVDIREENGRIIENAKTNRRYSVKFSEELPLFSVLRYER